MVLGALILGGLYLTSMYSYLLFHSLVELFSVVVACAMFLLAWNARRIMDNDYLLFLGIGYLHVAGVDVLHTLAYSGMNVFSGAASNIPTQLWIAGRFLEAGTIALAPVFLTRRLRAGVVFALFLTLFIGLVLSIFCWPVFPTTYLEGQGLTPFKILSEYAICALLAGALYVMHRHRERMDRRMFRLLAVSVLLTIVSELAFTEYVSVFGFFNLLGHLLKLLSFYFIYRAVIVMGLAAPYEVLFRNLRQREKRLAESEHRYRTLVELSPDAVAVEAEGRVLYVNTAARELFGASRPEELPGSFVLELVDPVSREFFGRLSRGKGRNASWRRPETLRLVRLDGSRFDAELSGAPIAYDGRPATLLVFRDVTEKKQAEEAMRAVRDELEQRVRERTAEYLSSMELLELEVAERTRAEAALRASSQMLETFFKHTFTPLVFLDRQFNFIRVNEAYARACKREVSEFPGRNHFELYPSEAREVFEGVVRTAKPFKTAARPFQFPDHPEWGTTYWDWELIPLLDEQGQVQSLVFVLEDVTQRTQSEAKMRQLNRQLEERAQQLHQLADRLLQAEQQERRRIALLIHDHLQQLLVSAKIRVTLLARDTKACESLDTLQQLGQLIQESIEVSRTLSVELCPPSLYREGLAGALGWLGGWMQDKHALSVTVEADQRAEPEAEVVSTLLFQSVRELLFNVLKHSGVCQAEVVMRRLGRDRLRITVRDDGTGFDTAAALREEPAEQGLGLFSIGERLNLVGGRMVVRSRRGGGSRITLEAPLKASPKQP
jgi:PAS domain S-box-containing protein